MSNTTFKEKKIRITKRQRKRILNEYRGENLGVYAKNRNEELLHAICSKLGLVYVALFTGFVVVLFLLAVELLAYLYHYGIA